LHVVETRLEKKRFFLNVQHKSAERHGSPADRTKTLTIREASTWHDSKAQSGRTTIESWPSGKGRQVKLGVHFSEGAEAPVGKRSAESVAPDEQWMERVSQRENLWQGLIHVEGSGGSPGIDGMMLDDLTHQLPGVYT
jgi:hypothetical protein